MPENEKMIAAYIPVFHQGYMELLDRHPQASVKVLGQDVLKRFDYLRKDIRALDPGLSARIISGLGRQASVISEQGIEVVMNSQGLIMPDDDVSRSLAAEYNSTPCFEPVFLRWDRANSVINSEVIPDRSIILEQSDPVIEQLRQQAANSTNWWRAVAAAIIDNDQVSNVESNSSVPTIYSSAIDNDPRITASRGEAIERSIDIHAEAKLIASAAQTGEQTAGKDIFVTTFPCANCAKLIVEAGFKSCYFIDGYANLDGQSIMKQSGVEIVKIHTAGKQTDDTANQAPQRSMLKKYPTS